MAYETIWLIDKKSNLCIVLLEPLCGEVFWAPSQYEDDLSRNEYNCHTWQVSPQLRCCDTSQKGLSTDLADPTYRNSCSNDMTVLFCFAFLNQKYPRRGCRHKAVPVMKKGFQRDLHTHNHSLVSKIKFYLPIRGIPHGPGVRTLSRKSKA